MSEQIQLSNETRERLENLKVLYDRSGSDVLDLALLIADRMAFALIHGMSINIFMEDQDIKWTVE